ncbi:MAG: peptide ABC transporter substrate-binding protein [Pyrinomonadaceae bacterium]
MSRAKSPGNGRGSRPRTQGAAQLDLKPSRRLRRIQTNGYGFVHRRRIRFFLISLITGTLLLSGGCFEGEQGETFYGQVRVPHAQEFRWSDGGLPQVFDPARAATPPDTDAVRALFEGLTDYDPATLKPLPAVAKRWESAEDGRVWIFYLREDAKWSNGDPVTAGDFVRSWQRTLRLGERAPHANLLANIEGAQEYEQRLVANRRSRERETIPTTNPANPSAQQGPDAKVESRPEATPLPNAHFGAEAVDAHTLKVTLLRPDKNFPSLATHPVFRPIHELSLTDDIAALRDEQLPGEGGDADLTPPVVTNGAFRLGGLSTDGVLLERAQNYWDASSVQLERVRFVNSKSAEESLAAYKAGEVDAVTNAAFEPLAVKLLTPYKDFRRDTFGALTYYNFNATRPPFDDPRVRSALALALDLERLSADILEGATEPARKFLPVQKNNRDGATAKKDDAETDIASEGESADEAKAKDDTEAAPIKYNPRRAQALLAEAGFPNGENFPRVRLLINRNEPQRLLAQAVARMWRNALGIQTDILIRNWEDYEAVLKSGDYDVARRSIVLQTTDEETNMLAMFGEESASTPLSAEPLQPSPTEQAEASPLSGATHEINQMSKQNPSLILSEAQALRELPAIPIYFASSYAMVKPYVGGFDSNLLDAPSLKNVSINTEWRMPPPKDGVKIIWGTMR